jgi:minor histocompatibility antigen H13
MRRPSQHAHMILAAVLTIYIGSFLSLDQSSGVETMETGDALRFPFVAGAGLAVLFVAFKYLPTLWVNRLLLLYFVALGIPTVATLIGPLVRLATPHDKIVVTFEVPYIGTIRWTPADVASHAAAAVVAIFYGATKHWLLNNLLGVAFTVEGIRQISVGSYKTGALALSGLFICEYRSTCVRNDPAQSCPDFLVSGPSDFLPYLRFCTYIQMTSSWCLAPHW